MPGWDLGFVFEATRPLLISGLVHAELTSVYDLGTAQPTGCLANCSIDKFPLVVSKQALRTSHISSLAENFIDSLRQKASQSHPQVATIGIKHEGGMGEQIVSTAAQGIDVCRNRHGHQAILLVLFFQEFPWTVGFGID